VYSGELLPVFTANTRVAEVPSPLAKSRVVRYMVEAGLSKMTSNRDMVPERLGNSEQCKGNPQRVNDSHILRRYAGYSEGTDMQVKIKDSEVEFRSRASCSERHSASKGP
jgi:hypothetical protein